MSQGGKRIRFPLSVSDSETLAPAHAGKAAHKSFGVALCLFHDLLHHLKLLEKTVDILDLDAGGG